METVDALTWTKRLVIYMECIIFIKYKYSIEQIKYLKHLYKILLNSKLSKTKQETLLYKSFLFCYRKQTIVKLD